MSEISATENDLLTWTEQCIKNEDFVEFEITITGKSEKGDGYLGEIAFVTVNGSTKHNGKKCLNFVIKYAKSNEYLRKISPVKDAYETEIHFYDKIIPILEKFQLENNIQDKLESPPKCYKTMIMENMEVIFLDNLKKRGYELHDRQKPLNVYHIKSILKEYGKLHALSFALRDQKSKEFTSVTSNRPDVFKQFFIDEGLSRTFQKAFDEAIDMLLERKECVLAEKLKNLLTKSPCDMLLDLMEVEETQSVIAHGDCWNNNFLFKYENDDKTSPSKVAILDWQLSAVRSPVFDISYLIYAVSSKEELDRFSDLIEVYYASFSNFLLDLGCNPEELFTYSDLKRHWNKYSTYGLLIAPMILKFALCSQEDAPSFEDVQEGENLGEMMDVNVAHKDLYYGRVRDALRHYFEETF